MGSETIDDLVHSLVSGTLSHVRPRRDVLLVYRENQEIVKQYLEVMLPWTWDMWVGGCEFSMWGENVLWLFRTGKTRLASKRVKQGAARGNAKNCPEFHTTVECPAGSQWENLGLSASQHCYTHISREEHLKRFNMC